MILNVVIYKAVAFSIGVFAATSGLLVSGVRQLIVGKSDAVEDIWTVQDLSRLAKSKKLEAAVCRLTFAAYGPGTPNLEIEEIQDVIDTASDKDIRTALLMVANGKGSRKKDPVDAYARTDNAAATCGAEGTAGADGLDLCVTRCEATRFKSPRKGACYMLCSLAVAPCANGHMMSVEKWVAGTVETMTPGYNWMANNVGTVASFSRAKGMAMARYVAASSTSGYHWTVGKVEMIMTEYGWVAVEMKTMACAALDYLSASDTLQVVLLLLWSFVYAMRTKAACRAMVTDARQTKKHLKKARNEVRRIKLNRLFKIRGRLLKHEGFYALHNFSAWAIYRASVEEANAQRKNASCKRLGRFFSVREKRAVAVRLVRWRMAAATMSAVADKASSEGAATDGEDKGPGSASSDAAGDVAVDGGG
eukprot:jgi/Undpi1/3629/HiC_scaffold_16.g06999.m1